VRTFGKSNYGTPSAPISCALRECKSESASSSRLSTTKKKACRDRRKTGRAAFPASENLAAPMIAAHVYGADQRTGVGCIRARNLKQFVSACGCGTWVLPPHAPNARASFPPPRSAPIEDMPRHGTQMISKLYRIRHNARKEMILRKRGAAIAELGVARQMMRGNLAVWMKKVRRGTAPIPLRRPPHRGTRQSAIKDTRQTCCASVFGSPLAVCAPCNGVVSGGDSYQPRLQPPRINLLGSRLRRSIRYLQLGMVVE